MGVYIILITIFMLTLCPGSRAQGCLRGCYCRRGSMSCYNFQTFPDLTGTTVSDISIYGSNFTEIPPYAFKGNPNLKDITIYNTNIGRVRSCAFKGLTKLLTSVSIYRVKIDVVEPGAFAEVLDNSSSSMSIYSSTINTIEPYAFTSIKGRSFSMYLMKLSNIKPFGFNNLTFRDFSIYSSNMKTVETSAFSNFTNVNSVDFYLNNMTTLRCNSLKTFFSDAGDVSFYSNYLKCDCEIAWLLESSLELPSSVKCWSPSGLAKKPVRSVNYTTICPSGSTKTMCADPEMIPHGTCFADYSTTTKHTVTINVQRDEDDDVTDAAGETTSEDVQPETTTALPSSDSSLLLSGRVLVLTVVVLFGVL